MGPTGENADEEGEDDSEEDEEGNEDQADEGSDGSEFNFGGDGKYKVKSKKSKGDKDLFRSSRSDNLDKSSKPKRKTIVDDKFFSLADMERFLEREDAREERKYKQNEDRDEDESSEDEDEEEVDYFADIPSDDDEDEEMGVSAKMDDLTFIMGGGLGR